MGDADGRSILHIDMDAFYAAVEQRDNPALHGKPVLVGGRDGRGVVSTASYEARVFGCRSAMPMAQARRLCPHAIVVPPRMTRYADVSRQVFEILECFTPLIEPLSIDEAFLDVTDSIRLLGPPEQMAREIKRRVLETTQLTASVGVAPIKFVAKLASDFQKPDGLVVVSPDGVAAFLAPLSIGRMWGVGKATLPKMESLGVRTFGDLLDLPRAVLHQRFGEWGTRFFDLVRGIDDRDVVPDRAAKSISHEETFGVDATDVDFLRATLLDKIDHVAARLRRHGLAARCVVLKVRSPDFHTITRRTTLDGDSDETQILWRALEGLFESWRMAGFTAVRLIGAGVTELTHSPQGRQLGLFETKTPEKLRRLDRAVDDIRARFGDGAVRRGETFQRDD